MKKFAFKSLNDLIRKYDWIVTGVSGGAVYTVGLVDAYKHPELAMHGLHPNAMHACLVTAAKLVALGAKFSKNDQLTPEIFDRFLAKFVAVDKSNYQDWFGQASDYHSEDFDILQVVWPDAAGRFPGEANYYEQGQLLFDVRQPGYDQIVEVPLRGKCACCGKPLLGGKHGHKT